MKSISQIEPLVSTVVSIIFLLLGAAAVYTKMKVAGDKDSPQSAAYSRIHHRAGWGFTALFSVMFVYMIVRVVDYHEEFSARVAFHFTLAAALVVLLIVKTSIPRKFPNLNGKLFLLGTAVYLLAFSTVFISAGYHIEKIVSSKPYVYHGAISSGFADERLGKEFLIMRCSSCHLLDRILKPRSAPAWEEAVNRMVTLAQPRISPAEASQILGYLVSNYTPRARESLPGDTLIEKHCLPCHQPKDIYLRHYPLYDWKLILKKMNSYDAKLVPSEKIDIIANYLVRIQDKEMKERP